MTTRQAGELVSQFESCVLPREEWTHEAHFIMAFWYCLHLPLPVALQKIKDGIRKYNVSIGGANTDNAGYHETITVFYTRLIINYIFKTEAEPKEQRLRKLLEQPFIKKDFALQFYTRDLLMSKEARKNWIPPDIGAIN